MRVIDLAGCVRAIEHCAALTRHAPACHGKDARSHAGVARGALIQQDVGPDTARLAGLVVAGQDTVFQSHAVLAFDDYGAGLLGDTRSIPYRNVCRGIDRRAAVRPGRYVGPAVQDQNAAATIGTNGSFAGAGHGEVCADQRTASGHLNAARAASRHVHDAVIHINDAVLITRR